MVRVLKGIITYTIGTEEPILFRVYILIPVRPEILIFIALIWSAHYRFSSIKTLENLVQIIRDTICPIMLRDEII